MNGVMKRVSRIALVGLGWLTALMTLVAGIPHFRCQCPDGGVKPFCLAFGSTHPSGCCCGGACCSAQGQECCCRARPASLGEPDEPSCCAATQAAPAEVEMQQAAAVGARRTHCEKSAAQVTELGVTHSRTIADAGLAPADLLPLGSAFACPPLPDRSPVYWSIRLPAPPGDLIVLLH